MPTVIAHRGAAGHAPENTLAALDLGLEMGADRLEFDLRLTADGHLVALHDPTLERTAADVRSIADLTLADLESIAEASRPPTLEDILERFGRSVPLSIELKDAEPPAEELLLEALTRHAIGDAQLMSFESDCVERLRELGADRPLVQLYRLALSAEHVLSDLDRVASFCTGIGRAFELVDEQLVEAARERDLAVYAYVVNDEAEMERLASLGVAGLITDVPDLARAFVDRLAATPR